MKEKVDKPKKLKVFSVVCTVLTVLIAVLAAAILINVIVAKVRNKPVSFFGISFSIVVTDSMYPEINKGDLIIFRKCEYNDIKVNDNIVFVADENFQKEVRGNTIVHKVQSITEDGIITKGVHNQTADKGYREASEIYGICTANSSFWGKIFKFLSKFGIIIIIILVALPFIIGQIVKIVKLSKQKEGADNGDATATDGAENKDATEIDGKQTEESILNASDDIRQEIEENTRESDDNSKSSDGDKQSEE